VKGITNLLVSYNVSNLLNSCETISLSRTGLGGFSEVKADLGQKNGVTKAFRAIRNDIQLQAVRIL
jgi:hypothetical protein